MKNRLFFTSFCLISLVCFNSANALPITNRVSSVKSLPQKNSASSQSSITGAQIANTLTSSKTTSEPKVILAESDGTERLGLVKKPSSVTTKSYNNSNTSSKIDTPSIVIPSDILALYDQIADLQSQLATVQNELARKAESSDVASINNTISNKLDNLDNKFENLDKVVVKDNQLDTKLENHLANKKVLTKANLEEELSKQDFVKSKDLPEKGFLTSSDLSDKVDKILKTKNYLTTKDKEDLRSAIVVAKTNAVAEADTAAAEKFVKSETLNKTINNIDEKITNVASGAIDETALQGHFNKFLDKELKDTTSTGKFRGFLTTADKVTLNNAIASAKSETQNKFDALDNRFEGKGAIAAAFDTSKEDSILSKALKDTSATGLGRKFRDIDDVVATNKDKLETLSNNAKSFVTLNDIEQDLQNESNGLLGKRLKTLDTRITSVSEQGLDPKAVRNLLSEELDETNGLIGQRFASLDNRFVKGEKLGEEINKREILKDFVKGDKLGEEINKRELLKGLVTDDEVESKLVKKGFLTGDKLGEEIKSRDILKGFVTDDDVETKLGKKGFLTGDKLGEEIKNRDILKGLVTDDEVESKLVKKGFLTGDDVDQKLINELKEDGKIGKGIKGMGFLTNSGFESKAAEMKLLTGDKLGEEIKNRDILKGLATSDDVETKIGKVNDKFANYTTTSGLGSVISGRIKTDLGDSNSDLAKKFGAYATTSDLNTVDGKFASYTTTDNMATTLAKKISGNSSATDLASALATKGGYATQSYADSKASAAQTAAIAAAASDATSKANQALADAKSDASGKYATTSSLGSYAKTSDITADKLATALSGKFATPSDITADKLATTLSGKFLTESAVATALGGSEVKTLAGLKTTLATKSSLDELTSAVAQMDNDISDISTNMVIKEGGTVITRPRRIIFNP